MLNLLYYRTTKITLLLKRFTFYVKLILEKNNSNYKRKPFISSQVSQKHLADNTANVPTTYLSSKLTFLQKFIFFLSNLTRPSITDYGDLHYIVTT